MIQRMNVIFSFSISGTGGHTTEMLRLVGELGSAYQPRHYIVADTDVMSRVKIEALEKARSSSNCKVDPFTLILGSPH